MLGHSLPVVLGETHGLKPPPWPSTPATAGTACMSYFTGDPGKELVTRHQPEEFGKGQEDSTSQNPSCGHPSWLSHACPPGRIPSRNGWRRQPKNQCLHLKPEIASRLTGRLSWAPSPSCCPPGAPSHENLFLCQHMARVSLDNSVPSVR